MADQGIPSNMRAWQYTSANGGLENAMQLKSGVALPNPKPNQHLLRVIATALNPVDFKPAETPILGRFAVPKPATPGIDVVGRIIKPASGSSFKVGDLVFGMAGASALAGGAMAEYVPIDTKAAAAVPHGVNPVDAGVIGVAGLTAYQSIVPHVKPGSRVFVNGGSGGCGIFGLQIAKALGCHVTTSCSTVNVELCKSLGADEVLDYKKENIVEQLKKQQPFDHIVDNVGYDQDMYWQAHKYTKPAAKYVFVGAAPSLSFFSFIIKANFWPGFLGGGKRKIVMFFAVPKADQLAQIVDWMVQGKVKAVIDQKFAFEQGADAMRRMKTGRAKGKIVINVSPEAGKT